MNRKLWWKKKIYDVHFVLRFFHKCRLMFFREFNLHSNERKHPTLLLDRNVTEGEMREPEDLYDSMLWISFPLRHGSVMLLVVVCVLFFMKSWKHIHFTTWCIWTADGTAESGLMREEWTIFVHSESWKVGTMSQRFCHHFSWCLTAQKSSFSHHQNKKNRGKIEKMSHNYNRLKLFPCWCSFPSFEDFHCQFLSIFLLQRSARLIRHRKSNWNSDCEFPIFLEFCILCTFVYDSWVNKQTPFIIHNGMSLV